MSQDSGPAAAPCWRRVAGTLVRWLPGPLAPQAPRRGPAATLCPLTCRCRRRCPPRPPRPPSVPGLPATGREERWHARSTTGSRRTRPRRRSPERKEGRAASVVKGQAGPLYGGVGRLLFGGGRPGARVECEAGASAARGRERVGEEPSPQRGRARPPPPRPASPLRRRAAGRGTQA